MIKEWLARFIIKWAVEKFTIENLKTVLENCIAYLKVKAIETETIVDDWAIDAMENIIDDETKLSALYFWLLKFIGKNPDGVCCQAVPTDSDWEELAEKVSTPSDGQTCQAIPWTEVAKLLQLILPYLIEWWRNQK